MDGEQAKAVLINNRLRQGGKIVSSNQCTEEQITEARYHGYFYVDSEGFGYVYLPDTHQYPTAKKYDPNTGIEV